MTRASPEPSPSTASNKLTRDPRRGLGWGGVEAMGQHAYREH
jgi:hypothetical protein